MCFLLKFWYFITFHSRTHTRTRTHLFWTQLFSVCFSYAGSFWLFCRDLEFCFSFSFSLINRDRPSNRCSICCALRCPNFCVQRSLSHLEELMAHDVCCCCLLFFSCNTITMFYLYVCIEWFSGHFASVSVVFLSSFSLHANNSIYGQHFCFSSFCWLCLFSLCWFYSVTANL